MEHDIDDLYALIEKFYESYRRDHPTYDAESFNMVQELAVVAGKKGTMVFEVPVGKQFYVKSMGWEYYASSTLRVTKDDGAMIRDGVSVEPQDVSASNPTFIPAEIVNNNVKIEITNDDSSDHTYRAYISGWAYERKGLPLESPNE